MRQGLRQSMGHAGALLVCVGVLALVSPMLEHVTEFNRDLLVKCGVNISLALSLMLLLGLAGQFSLGHAGFLAVGAYTAMVLAVKPEFYLPQLHLFHEVMGLSIATSFSMVLAVGVVAGTVLSAFLGLLVGLPTLRLRGDYLAIATLGFGEIVRVVVQNSDYLKSTSGISIGERTLWLGAQPKPLTGMLAEIQAYMGETSQYVSLLAIGGGVLVTLALLRNIKYSTTGRALLAVREDLVAAESVGVPTTRYKVVAFTISAGLAGMAGGLLSHHTTLTPNDFDFNRSITLVAMVILGGQGSITGTVLAAIGLTVAPEMMRGIRDIERWRLVIYAVMIIAAMLFRPQGIFGSYEIGDLARWVWRKVKGKSSKANVKSSRPEAGMPGEGAMAPSWARGGPPTAQSAEGGRPPLELADAGKVLLEARQVGMSFGGLRAVDGFNLSLRSGELVGLIGPNGAGKTTVFNVLTGVYRPTDGGIWVGGPPPHSIVREKPHAICKRGVARTFQNIRLFGNLSVLDNVQIAQHMHHRQGIPAAVFRLPSFFDEEHESRENAMGYLEIFRLDHLARERAGGLSYGDQRRLEIARALATRPRILLLDEPAAGMNPTEKRALMELIRDVRRRFGLTILIIEHDMKVIMGICERILVLDYGKTIAEGSPEEIRHSPAVIEAYLGASAKHG